MDKIEQVIEDFDFEKLQQIIDVTSGDAESVDDLKSHAIVALRDVSENNKFETKKTGFKAKRNLNGVLSLSYDVTLKSSVQ